MSLFATEVTSVQSSAGDRQHLLDEVSLRIGPRERVGLVGASGSGKSLLLRALVGLLPPGLCAEGHLSLDGQRYDLGDVAGLATIRRGGLALLPQSAASSLDPTRRVDAQLAEVEGLSGRGTSTQSRRASLGQVNLDPAILHAFPHELSGGEAQRVALALALAGRPRILLADEPTANLDTVNGAQVLSTLDDAAANHDLALLLISHDLAEVASRCPRTIVLDRGRVVEEGETQTLLKEPKAEATRRLVVVAERREAELSAAPREPRR